MSLFLIVAFLAGILTVLAPCILPLLPAIIGGSLSGERNIRRALIVTLSLGISVLVFTLLLKASAALVTVPPVFWKLLSGSLLMAFGLVTLFPGLWERLSFATVLNRSGNRALALGAQKKSVWGDVVVGGALGPVFTSCSPTYFIVLATVIPARPIEGALYLLAYVAGLTLALLAIAIAGQRLANSLGASSDPRGLLKRSIAALFIILGVAIILGLDTRIAASLPQSAYGITGVEQRLLSLATPTSTGGKCDGGACSQTGPAPATTSPLIQAELERKAALFPRAPELVAPDGYLNTAGAPITIGEFLGKKVVLIDFWTYSCINCLRTLPHIKAWNEKYKEQGLVIIGVHTPEFAFEGVRANIEKALADQGITYPVVMDNQFRTWSAFSNQYWPRKYLIDIDGFIVYDHAGEGEYEMTEEAIRAALMERALRLHTPLGSLPPTAPPDSSASTLSFAGSPETYFGSARNEFIGNGTPGESGVHTFTAPTEPDGNRLYLDGMWNVQPEYAESNGTSRIIYRYSARDVYFVASANAPTDVVILQDGLPVTISGGADVRAGTARIRESRLYHLIQNDTPGTHTLELQIKGKGLKAFTFTFG